MNPRPKGRSRGARRRMLALLALNRPVGSLYGAIPWPSIAMTVSTRGDLATSPLSRGHMSSDCPAAAIGREACVCVWQWRERRCWTYVLVARQIRRRVCVQALFLSATEARCKEVTRIEAAQPIKIRERSLTEVVDAGEATERVIPAVATHRQQQRLQMLRRERRRSQSSDRWALTRRRVWSGTGRQTPCRACAPGSARQRRRTRRECRPPARSSCRPSADLHRHTFGQLTFGSLSNP